MVRFGNVLDSSGSVIPKFKKQIKERLPLTVTHTDITRFYDYSGSCRISYTGWCHGKRWRGFVLDMGEPVKIYDLAKK